jgi:hypothetical protein
MNIEWGKVLLMLALATIFALFIRRDLRTGTTSFRGSHADRRTNPIGYWASLIFEIFMALMGLVGAVLAILGLAH